jgi:4,5-dihydroxyphthalate decarboxylase
MRRQLTFACGNYDRTQDLIEGTIKPDGLELNWLTMPHDEMWLRMLNHQEFDASEMSFASYIIARTAGTPLLGIPIFPARAFRHSYIFINTKSGIQEPRDLIGKRVALKEFQQTAVVWLRGILRHDYGVAADKIHWLEWAQERSMQLEIPSRYDVQVLPPKSAADQLLIKGEIDAVVCTSLFPSFVKGHPNIRRLFEDHQAVERAYFKRTRIFPIMHTVVMREELWRECPWIGPSLFKAFQEAKQLAYRRVNDLSPYQLSMTWFREPLREQQDILGDDPWSYGLAPNRKAIETLIDYVYEQGFTAKKVRAEELFAPNTLDL